MKAPALGIPFQQVIFGFAHGGVFDILEPTFASVNAKAVPAQTSLRLIDSTGERNLELRKVPTGWKVNYRLARHGEITPPEKRLRNILLIEAARRMKGRGLKVQCTAYDPQTVTVWIDNLQTGEEVITAAKVAIRQIGDEAIELVEKVGPDLRAFEAGLGV